MERGFYENYRWVPSFSQGLLFIFGVFSLGFAVVNDQFPPLWGPAYSIFFYSAVLLPVVTQAAALGEKGGTPLRKKQEAPVQPSNIKQAVVPLLAVLILVVVLSI
ncbi:hypothetical protein, partial [Streptomyces alboviridis]|uniref:hypothetical protein n=1 Tax=Streptomyces alboviridis TaxID=67269 RepID=UPI001F193BF4